MTTIDCHVLTRPGENQAWLAQCLDSIRHPDVSVHVIDGVKDNVGAGRARGFAVGDAPFVTFVDSDDWAEEGAFDKILAHISDTGLCTAEYVRFGNQSIIRDIDYDIEVSHKNYFKAHHFLILPRAAVQPHLTELAVIKNRPNMWLMERVTQSIATIPFLKEPLYNWRIHDDQYHRRYGRGDI